MSMQKRWLKKVRRKSLPNLWVVVLVLIFMISNVNNGTTKYLDQMQQLAEKKHDNSRIVIFSPVAGLRHYLTTKNNSDQMQQLGEKKHNDNRPVIFNHVSVSGLGHRLGRMSSSFHLAVRLNTVDRIHPDWKNCFPLPQKQANSSEYRSNIWDVLFGPDDLKIPPVDAFKEEILNGTINFHREPCQFASKEKRPFNPNPSNNQTLTYRTINEVPGYDNFFLQFDLPFTLSKQRTDEEFYRLLTSRFLSLHRKQFDSFFERNDVDFSKSTVLGLHVRVGSIGDKDFENIINKRAFKDIASTIENLIKLLSIYVDRHGLIGDLPIILFVATDKKIVLDYVNASINELGAPMKLVSLEQEEVSFLGSSFAYKEGQSGDDQYQLCMTSWVNSMMDMVLLGMVDVLFAASQSSFPQTLPLSMVMCPFGWEKWLSKKENKWPASFKPFPPYCEAGEGAISMTCHDSRVSILTHRTDQRHFYTLNNSDNSWGIDSNHKCHISHPWHKCAYCEGWLQENNLCFSKRTTYVSKPS